MEFKVGDKVKILNTKFGNKDKIGTITNISGTVMIYFVEIEGDCGHGFQWSNASDLELVTEEETSMKFKVGDKVKVKDSWFGHNGKVGVVASYTNGKNYPYRVDFDDQGDRSDEVFCEESLELVEEKTFTKSDLKTGMGVVLRNGRKGHILIGTGCVDVIRFLENGNYSCLNDFSDDLTSNYRKEHDIVEVYFTEYQFKLLTDQVFYQECVFKREEEPTKMTMKEINEHFGKQIEIVE